MSACPAFTHLLVLPHLQVQNANAVSSSLTHGFPSMTAFLGLMWALERKGRAAGIDLSFRAVGAVCHDHQEQVTEDGFVKAFHLTRNPVSKDGSTAAIVEEGRIHLDLSLILAVDAGRWLRDPHLEIADTAQISEWIASMRIAGGIVISPPHPQRSRYRPWTLDLTGNEEDRAAQFRKARMRLLPGFALVERPELIDLRLEELQATHPSANRLDAWLSLSRINWRYQAPERDGTKGEWIHDRQHGWIVPIPVGYGALGGVHNAGSIANARDSSTPFRFVESLYSIGEWISPHRLQSARQLLWYADSRPDDDLYRCRNDYFTAVAQTKPFDELELDFD